VNGHFRRAELPYQNAATVSREISWKLFNASSALTDIIYSFENLPHLGPSSKSEMEEPTDGELENAGAGEGLECDEESDNEVFSWDALLIEDDDDSEAVYF
jgi:hypothetical protein